MIGNSSNRFSVFFGLDQNSLQKVVYTRYDMVRAKIHVVILSVIIPCSLIGGYQHSTNTLPPSSGCKTYPLVWRQKPPTTIPPREQHRTCPEVCVIRARRVLALSRLWYCMQIVQCPPDRSKINVQVLCFLGENNIQWNL
jgi:hypothetical protein